MDKILNTLNLPYNMIKIYTQILFEKQSFSLQQAFKYCKKICNSIIYALFDNALTGHCLLVFHGPSTFPSIY